MKICFLIGHRDAHDSLYPRLYELVKEHITEFKVSEFIAGQHGSFDRMSARAVREDKSLYPETRLTLLLPYHPGRKTVCLPDGFDGSWYPFEEERIPRKFAIVRANQRAVERSDYLIAYAPHAGNARNLLEYAEKSGKIHVTKILTAQASGRDTRPMTEDEAMLAELQRIIRAEESKPEEERDDGLIDDCIKEIVEIKGVKAEFSKEEIDDLLRTALISVNRTKRMGE